MAALCLHTVHGSGCIGDWDALGKSSMGKPARNHLVLHQTYVEMPELIILA